MGNLPVLEGHLAFQTHGAPACVCELERDRWFLEMGEGWFQGGSPDHCPAPGLALAPCPPHPPTPRQPSPIHGPAASCQPPLSVMADVWLCHGNARTGCTSGSRQGRAHAQRLPTQVPSPNACCEEPLGSRLGTNGVCTASVLFPMD